MLHYGFCCDSISQFNSSLFPRRFRPRDHRRRNRRPRQRPPPPARPSRSHPPQSPLPERAVQRRRSEVKLHCEALKLHGREASMLRRAEARRSDLRNLLQHLQIHPQTKVGANPLFVEHEERSGFYRITEEKCCWMQAPFTDRRRRPRVAIQLTFFVPKMASNSPYKSISYK